MEILAGQCGSARTSDDSPYTPDVSPKSSKVGAFLPRPPPFCEKISLSAHQKSRKGTNPIRPNDAIPSFLPIRRSAFVYTALYSDVPSVQTCKKNHPSFVSKLGWLYGGVGGIRTHGTVTSTPDFECFIERGTCRKNGAAPGSCRKRKKPENQAFPDKRRPSCAAGAGARKKITVLSDFGENFAFWRENRREKRENALPENASAVGQ